MGKTSEERLDGIEDFLWNLGTGPCDLTEPPEGPSVKCELDRMRRVLRETLELMRETAPPPHRDRIGTLIVQLEQRKHRSQHPVARHVIRAVS